MNESEQSFGHRSFTNITPVPQIANYVTANYVIKNTGCLDNLTALTKTT